MSAITYFGDDLDVVNEIDALFKRFFKNPNAFDNEEYTPDDFYKLSQATDLANTRQIREPFADDIAYIIEQTYNQYVVAVDLGKDGDSMGSGPYGKYFECICGIFYDEETKEIVLCVENKEGEPLEGAPSEQLIATVNEVIDYVKQRFGFELYPEDADEEPVHVFNGALSYIKDAGIYLYPEEYNNNNVQRGGGKYGVKRDLPTESFMNRFIKRGKAEEVAEEAPKEPISQKGGDPVVLEDTADRPVTRYPVPAPIDFNDFLNLLHERDTGIYPGVITDLPIEKIITGNSRDLNLLENLMERRPSYTPTITENNYPVYSIDEYVQRFLDMDKLYVFYKNRNSNESYVIANMFQVNNLDEAKYATLNTKVQKIIGLDRKVIKSPSDATLYRAYSGPGYLSRFLGTFGTNPYTLYHLIYDIDLDNGAAMSAMPTFTGPTCPTSINDVSIHFTNGYRNGVVNSVTPTLMNSNSINDSFILEGGRIMWKALLYILIDLPATQEIKEAAIFLKGQYIQQSKALDFAIKQNTVKDIAPQLMYLINKDAPTLMRRLFKGNMIYYSSNPVMIMAWYAVCHALGNILYPDNPSKFYEEPFDTKQREMLSHLDTFKDAEGNWVEPIKTYIRWINPESRVNVEIFRTYLLQTSELPGSRSLHRQEARRRINVSANIVSSTPLRQVIKRLVNRTNTSEETATLRKILIKRDFNMDGLSNDDKRSAKMIIRGRVLGMDVYRPPTHAIILQAFDRESAKVTTTEELRLLENARDFMLSITPATTGGRRTRRKRHPKKGRTYKLRG